MRALLILAAVALLYAAGPADAAPRTRTDATACAAKAKPARAGRPVAARRGAARRRAAVLRRRCAAARRERVGQVSAGRAGIPGAFVAPASFATAPPATPVAATPGPTAPGTPAPEQPTGPVLPPVYSNPYAVQVQGFEFGLQLSKAAVSAGSVRVEFNLARAEDPHNLWLVREDGSGSPYSFDEAPSGAVVARTLALTRGRWKLFCSLTGHEAAGMRATLTVD